jgi:hypothetical protein
VLLGVSVRRLAVAAGTAPLPAVLAVLHGGQNEIKPRS